MKVQRTPAETEQIKLLLERNMSFRKVFRDDWTENIMNDLWYSLFGKIPRNFVVNISGMIGTPTGIFKSTMGLQMALRLDRNFDLHNRVAFSIEELLHKVMNYSEYDFCTRCYKEFAMRYHGTYEMQEKDSVCRGCRNQARHRVLLTKMIFFLDEQTRTLRRGSLNRLINLIDTCRQRQICFITCGVDQYDVNFTTYSLKRVQESSDDYLPKKIVRYAIYDETHQIYYGYFQWNVTPLTDPFWSVFWDKYSDMKTEFQRKAIQQRTQANDFRSKAQVVLEDDDFDLCYRTLKNGEERLQTNMVRNIIFRHFPDLTNEERNFILSEVLMIERGGDYEQMD